MPAAVSCGEAKKDGTEIRRIEKQLERARPQSFAADGGIN